MRTESPIVPRSIFISYSNKDMEFIDKLEGYFDKDGIRSWRDVRDMVAGPIEQQIDRSIKLQQVVLLVISENSIGSDWVQWEVRKARELEQKLQKESGEKVSVLCPVSLDGEWWKDSNPWPERLKAQLQEYHILDLSHWKDDSKFEAQYERLKKGLGIYYANKESGE